MLRANIRLITAYHHDLTQERYKDLFSRDLLYHLMQNSLRIPALHERPGDIPLLAGYFLKMEAASAGKKIAILSPELVRALQKYDFPDNMRELKNLLATAVARQDGGVLTLNALAPHMQEKMAQAVARKGREFFPRRLAEVEREHAARMLSHFHGDRSKTAEALGVDATELDVLLSGEMEGTS